MCSSSMSDLLSPTMSELGVLSISDSDGQSVLSVDTQAETAPSSPTPKHPIYYVEDLIILQVSLDRIR